MTGEPWTGHPKLSLSWEDRSLILKSIKDHKLVAPLLKYMWNIWKEEDNATDSSITGKRRLIYVEFNGKILRRKLLRYKQQWLQYTKDHRDWTEDMWKKIIWSVESKFHFVHSDVGCTYDADYQKLLRIVIVYRPSKAWWW